MGVHVFIIPRINDARQAEDRFGPTSIRGKIARKTPRADAKRDGRDAHPSCAFSTNKNLRKRRNNTLAQAYMYMTGCDRTPSIREARSPSSFGESQIVGASIMATTSTNANTTAIDRFEQQVTRGDWQRYRVTYADDFGTHAGTYSATTASLAAHQFIRDLRRPLHADAVVSLHGVALAIISAPNGGRPDVLSLPMVRNVLRQIPQQDFQRYMRDADRQAASTPPVDTQAEPPAPWDEATDGADVETIETTAAEIKPQPEKKTKSKKRSAADDVAAAILAEAGMTA